MASAREWPQETVARCFQPAEQRAAKSFLTKRMKFTLSLNKNYEFRRIYARGKSTAMPLVVLYCRKNGLNINRYGITVGSKVGKAVYRNKVRRRLREIYRLNETSRRTGWDIVAVARTRAKDASYAELEKAFIKAAERLGLLIQEARERF